MGLHESFVDMRIDTLSEEVDIPTLCTKCSSTLEKIYRRSEDSEIDEEEIDLLVFKCPRCKIIFSFWVISPHKIFWDTDLSENIEYTENLPLNIGKRREKRVPKKRVKDYNLAISAQDAKQRELYRIIQPKLLELTKAGLSLETITLARNKAACVLTIKKPTQKSLTKLIAAAIYYAANSVTMEESSLLRREGEGITEQQVEAIFGISRKTIRKWKKMFEEPFLHFSSKNH